MMLSTGVKAPSFTLSDIDGKPHSLESLLVRGPVLFALYKISCPVCQLTMPYLDRIAAGSRHSSAGASKDGALQIIGISQDDERSTRRFMSNYGLTMPTLLDREEDGYKVSNAFGIDHVPSLFLVEPDGGISLAVSGFSKRDLESIGHRAGVTPFHADENVPAWKAG